MTTPNHQYNVPDRGTEDWHLPLNENFQAFEVDIELRDQSSAIGNYQPTAGAKFLATDTGVVYTGDGSSWTALFVLPGYDQAQDSAQFDLSAVTTTGDIVFGGVLDGAVGASIDDWSGAADLDSSGTLTVSMIQALSGGNGISPGSIGDGDTLSVAPGDFAGTYLSTDASNNLTVDAGNGLENDGTDALQVSLGNALGFDGSNQVAVTTDSLTVSAGNGLQNGGSVSLGGSTTLDVNPADIAGTGLVDDGSSNLEVAWEDAGDLDADGNVTGVIASLTGGSGIAPSSIGDGDTLSVSWEDASDLDSSGAVADFSAATDLDASGTVTRGFVESLTGGEGISPDSIGNGDTVSVVAADLAGNALVDDGSNNLAVSTGGIGTTELALGAVTASEIAQAGATDGQVLRWDGLSWVTDFPGTTDSSTVFELKAGGTTVLQLDPNDTSRPNVVAGINHTVSSQGVTIGGGDNNTASGFASTVGGGLRNTASESNSTVAGGTDNTASGIQSTIGGGNENEASSTNATVSGGSNNTASDFDSTVCGGQNNTAGGTASTVAGGKFNEASGTGSFAAGASAKALSDGAFVWNDGNSYHDTDNDDTDDALSSDQAVNGESVTGGDTFSVGATGGARFIAGSSAVTYIPSRSTGWSTASSRTVKTNVDPVDPEQALDGVESMEVATWEYEDENGNGTGTTHIGPMAEDFHDAFEVGDSDEHINSVNADGIAFAAIQGLSNRLAATRRNLANKDERIDDQLRRIETLETSLAERDERIEEQRDRIEELEAEHEVLRERLAAVEERLTEFETDTPRPADD